MTVEQVTGNSLAEEQRQRIFEPLSLQHTYAVPMQMIEGPQAHGYSKGTDQTEVAMSFAFATANIVNQAATDPNDLATQVFDVLLSQQER
jgi:CubicO group peptidase (beta-lactamase class C family)